jgi:CheY-like chemotaxis protein
MVGLIETSGQTLEAILADVLDIARIESGRLELKPEPFDLGECLRSAAALFQPNATEKGLTFDLDIDPFADGVFVGDVVRIRQIVCNLLSNAVKFTGAGGVALSAGVDPGGRLAIAVSDTGIGFDDEAKARLFERFEQADGSITRRFGGTGLGLAISRALAEAMDGVLEAESAPGFGSRFTLTLRLQRGGEARIARDRPLAPVLAPGRTPKVLLAEDHIINRKVVELLFDGLDLSLTCVENGAEAVEAALHGRFDLILMDMQMPVMDGLAAIRAIRAAESPAGRQTPIWALSANALPEHVSASLTAGADGHLSKPVSAQALFAALAEACAAVRSAVAV